ncbi:hypothetical protein NIES4101_53950 [Calothrix sp. NIES-4101]|nr:hypothetical protein NIES4101_53950 [Calothrix sp. NIES-4101]
MEADKDKKEPIDLKNNIQGALIFLTNIHNATSDKDKEIQLFDKEGKRIA